MKTDPEPPYAARSQQHQGFCLSTGRSAIGTRLLLKCHGYMFVLSTRFLTSKPCVRYLAGRMMSSVSCFLLAHSRGLTRDPARIWQRMRPKIHFGRLTRFSIFEHAIYDSPLSGRSGPNCLLLGLSLLFFGDAVLPLAYDLVQCHTSAFDCRLSTSVVIGRLRDASDLLTTTDTHLQGSAIRS